MTSQGVKFNAQNTKLRISLVTRNFNVKVSTGEGKTFIGLVDTYTENKPVHSPYYRCRCL